MLASHAINGLMIFRLYQENVTVEACEDEIASGMDWPPESMSKEHVEFLFSIGWRFCTTAQAWVLVIE